MAGKDKEHTCDCISVSIDALPPKKMAEKGIEIGIVKADMGWRNTIVLGILAGAFIAMGGIFLTTVTAGASALPFGVTKLLGGLVFCLGLILVVVAGSELFTGNNLILMALVDYYTKKYRGALIPNMSYVTTYKLLRNWILVFLANLAGSLATVYWMFLTKQYTFGNGIIGLNALTIANAKCGLDFVQAIALGIGCNALVCLAVWLCFSARSTTDKILSIIFPITAFVAAGFEHCVANMYLIPMGLCIKSSASGAFWTAIGKTAADFPNLTLYNFLVGNLLPVTIGNIIGGALMVGLIYWFIYIREPRGSSPFVK
jgi:formate/nitrite transporter